MTNIFETRVGMALTALVLTLLAVGGLWWFGFHFVQLLAGVVRRDEVINFDKGAIYMLGGGVGIICLLVLSIPTALFGKNISKAVENWVVKGLLAGFVTMIVLPHLVHFGVWTTLKNSDYVICHDLGSRWLMHVTFVYTSSADKCEELIVKGR